MTERKTRSRLTGGIIAVIVLAVCLVVTTVGSGLFHRLPSGTTPLPPAASASTSTTGSR